MIDPVPTKSASHAFTELDEAGLLRLAQMLALGLRAGDTLALHGDLGAGKTTFARAMVRAFMGDADLEVISPTFSMLQTYEGARGRIEHYDLYRLNDASEAEELGLAQGGVEVIRIVEWPERLPSLRALSRLDIHIEDGAGPPTRKVALRAHGAIAARMSRLIEAAAFLAQAGWQQAQLHYLQGDASTRRYARLQQPEGCLAILMDAPRQPDGPIVRDGKPYSRIAHLAEDVRPFVAIARALRAAGLSAPAIFNADLEAGFLLIEDLGDGVFGRYADGGARQSELWTAAIDVLAAFRKANLPMRLAVGASGDQDGVHTLQPLDATILGIETALLPEWYWPEVHGGPMPADLRAEYEALWQPVIDLLLQAPKGWILRDVHSPNLLWLPERTGLARVGVIDFQDAIAGPWAHDVMSLLQDARVDVAADLEAELIARYCRQMSDMAAFDKALFEATYAAYGALRATRLLGLFVRLRRRDGKPDYLQHIPRNWRYLERNLRHPALNPLEKWYARHFPAELRMTAISP
jgi:N-acetylmuramate 1-kinase